MIWRWFWREWRTPSLLVVWLSLTLAVACVLALGRAGDRINQSVNYQSRDYLAGDLVLRGSHPADETWLKKAQESGLALSQQMSFNTMVFANDVPQLVYVKAADDAYPLYGELETDPPGLKPARGEILIAPRLAELLSVKPGQMLEVGDTDLKIAGFLIQEPDSGFNPFQMAPRVLINLQDVEATGAVQPGSRLTYRDMFAGAPDAVAVFKQQYEDALRIDQRWVTLKQEGGALAKSIDRAQQFLVLSALLTLLLAIAAVAVAMSHYCRSRHTLIAVLKTLGAGRRELRYWVVGQWAVLMAAAMVAGSLLGLIFDAILMNLLAPLLPKALPDPGLWPWAWALLTLLAITLLVGARPYRQLMLTQPTRVLRDDVVAPVWPLRWYLPLAVLIVAGGLAVLTNASFLLWAVLAGVVLIAALLAVAGYGGLWLLAKIPFRALSLRLAVRRLLRQPGQTLVQTGAFALSFMLLGLLVMVRGDLIGRWQQQLPPDTPNYFLVNMTEEQIAPVNQLLASHNVTPSEYYPVVLARLSGINGETALAWADARDPGNNTVRRELSLTWQESLPPLNELVDGTWPPKPGEVSIEMEVVKELGLKVGDTLTFTGDTRPFTVTVSSVRQVDWESMRPNFFFIFNHASLKNQSAMWLTSFHYDGNDGLITQMNRKYPSISIFDTGSMLKQIQTILAQVSRALEAMVVLVLICGVLLLLAQIQVGMNQRRTELVVYRTLGAGKRLLRRTLWSEFALLGAMAGVVAALGAETALWLLQTRVFDFPWQPQWPLWVGLPLAGGFLLSLCGSVLGIRLLGDSQQYRRLQS